MLCGCIESGDDEKRASDLADNVDKNKDEARHRRRMRLRSRPFMRLKYVINIIILHEENNDMCEYKSAH